MTYDMTGTMTAAWSEAEGIRVTSIVHTRDLCRRLVATGRTGSLVLNDAITGKPRLIVRDIAEAARWTVEETAARGFQMRPWRPCGLAEMRQAGMRELHAARATERQGAAACLA